MQRPGRPLAWIGCALTLLLLPSCGKKSSNPTQPQVAYSIPTETRQGTLAQSPGSTLALTQLQAVTLTDTAHVGADGSFAVAGPVATKYQIVFFNTRTTSQTVYMGLYDPATRKTTANDTTTALALTLINPYLLCTDQAKRQTYLQAVQANAHFGELVGMIAAAHAGNAEDALDFNANPALYQMVVQVARETMEGLGATRAVEDIAAVGPTLKDATGADIVFVNPTKVYYCAGVCPDGGTQTAVADIHRADRILSWTWAMPPVVVNEPKETTYSLGDGTFRLNLAKGLDFANFPQTTDPAKRATIFNSAQLTLYVIDVVVGWSPPFDAAKFVEGAHHLSLSASEAYDLTRAVQERDYLRLFEVFCSVVANNTEEVAYWIFQSTASTAAHTFLSSAGAVLKNVALVLKLYGLGNEQVPFLYDLIFAPSDVTYWVKQTDGVLTTTSTNEPPAAAFAVTPSAGTTETVFSFDASGTSDDHDALAALTFRWDFDSDGTWDTDWASTPTGTHQYSERGAWVATLQARDSWSSVGTVTHVVPVNGGSGTASHVKLFRDLTPWYSYAQETVLAGLGFTAGTGANQYEILPSSAMATTPLVPGVDLVIISNDQDQAFYDNYAANMVKFGSFAVSGGSLFWEACDLGWREGSMAAAGIVLPGDVRTNAILDYWNYVVNPNLPLVAGLPAAMDHNYASHEWFSNLPAGAIVYTEDGGGGPTLVEYSFGAGWVLITGQPLEHQYDRIYGAPDMEKLLPRIIAYFTGKPVNGLATRTLIAGSRPVQAVGARPTGARSASVPVAKARVARR